jgi:hypothetical protein
MPYEFIAPTECMGDSLIKINNNASDFDQRIISLTNVVASLSTALIAADVALTQAVLSAAPVGAVQSFAMATAPNGWLECNGVTVPNSTGTVQGKFANFTALYSAVGTTYSLTPGTIPDLRGEFIRGWANGKNVGGQSTRALGSAEDDAIRNITGEIKVAGSTGGMDGASGVFRIGGGTGYPAQAAFANNVGVGQFDASRVVPTAADNRPRNVALLYCIKY